MKTLRVMSYLLCGCLTVGILLSVLTGCKDNGVSPKAAEVDGAWIVKDNLLTDPDGNTYSTVKIGNQTWTVENLNTTKYNDGKAIPHVTDTDKWENLITPGYCYYQNSTSIPEQCKWGALYNWYAVNTGKLAPKGWRVPTDADWTALENYLIENGSNWDGTTSGNKIAKSMAAQTDWEYHANPGAPGNDSIKNNAIGFSALAGGCRFDYGEFINQNIFGYWWCATDNDTSHAFYRYLGFEYHYIGRYYKLKGCSFSVRLLRDNVRPE